MTEPQLNIDSLNIQVVEDVPPGVNGAEPKESILGKLGASEGQVKKPSSFLKKVLVGDPQGKPKERKVKEEKPVPPMPRGGKLASGLQDIYVSLGMMLMVVDPVCAQAIITAAPECAKSMEKLAQSNPAVRRVLLKTLETSAWGAVVAAHLPILMAVAAHHVPALKRGAMPAMPPVQYPRSDPPAANEYGGAGEGGSDDVQ